MNKSAAKSTDKTADRPEKAPHASAADQAPSPAPAHDGIRETIESIAVAFILAFLFRTFEAEAFVIPTGSMAPTLMGRHKDLICESCGYPYRVNAADEVDEGGARRQGVYVESCVCPLCRHRMGIGSPQKQAEYPSYNGDRILVAKFPYHVSEPQRWDVVVFKYPVEPDTNFIKRLIGLPQETVRIVAGDVYVKRPEDADFTIARKTNRRTLNDMLQIVYDNDYRNTALLDAGWPARWQPCPLPMGELLAKGWQAQPGQVRRDRFGNSQPIYLADTLQWPLKGDLPPGHWTTDDQGLTFATDGQAPGEVWLRYQHTVLEPWRTDELPRMAQQLTPVLCEIEDYNAYNQPRMGNWHSRDEVDWRWVGDLMLRLEAEVRSDSGELILELVEGSPRFQCRFDLATGLATLSCSDRADFRPQAQTSVKGKGVYRLAFSNIDDELLLWVDGELIQFDAPTTYQGLNTTTKGRADLSPVGVGASGAAVQVRHLVVERDIYYRATEFQEGFDDPNGVQFDLKADQFFVMGDNSARSLDARFWHDPQNGARLNYVERDLLVGRAVFIYWPHSWDKVQGTDIPFPFYPNFGRMGFVR